MQIETSELKRLFEAIEEQGLSLTEVIKRISNNDKAEEASKPAEEIITLIVDYGKNVKEMIKAGKYDWTNSKITERHFPLPTELSGKKISVFGKLFHFNRNISSEDAIKEMDKAGYRPATLPELLVLGEVKPDLQRQFSIIALGSVWRDALNLRSVPGLNVPGLDVGGNGRELNLGWFSGDWLAASRFLGVRK